MLEQCKVEEEKFKFNSLSHADFCLLGELLKEISDKQKKPVAIEVAIGDLVVYRYVPGGRGINELGWLKAKRGTVMAFGISSKHAMIKMESKGLKQETTYKALDPGKFALSGGGFPIKLKTDLVIGSICASGLTGDEDHSILIEALEKFMEYKGG